VQYKECLACCPMAMTLSKSIVKTQDGRWHSSGRFIHWQKRMSGHANCWAHRPKSCIMYGRPVSHSQSIGYSHARIVYRERSFMTTVVWNGPKNLTSLSNTHCPIHTLTGQIRPGTDIIDSNLSHSYTCPRAGKGTQIPRRFRTVLTSVNEIKQDTATGWQDLHSLEKLQ